MTVVARPLPTTQEKASAVRIQATDTHFFQAFAQAYHLARSQYRGLPLTDDIIFGSIRRVMTQPELSPHWKAGAITGWFAAIYHIPCRFDARHTPALPRPDRGIPRPIDLQYHDRDFLTAYRAGYQAFWAVVGDQPATDDGLFAELTRDYLPTLGTHTLQEARWCAGYIAGWYAALFRVPCFVADQFSGRSLAVIERRFP